MAKAAKGGHQFCRILTKFHTKTPNKPSKLSTNNAYNMIQHIRRHALTGKNKAQFVLYLFELSSHYIYINDTTTNIQ